MRTGTSGTRPTTTSNVRYATHRGSPNSPPNSQPRLRHGTHEDSTKERRRSPANVSYGTPGGPTNGGPPNGSHRTAGTMWTTGVGGACPQSVRRRFLQFGSKPTDADWTKGEDGARRRIATEQRRWRSRNCCCDDCSETVQNSRGVDEWSRTW